MFTDPEAQGARATYSASGDITWSGRRPHVAGDLIKGAKSPDTKTVAAYLDSRSMQDLHGRLLGNYVRELERQAINRQEMAIDEDFRDHIQYTAEDLEILKDRGQAAVTYNVIQTTLNWLTGSQRRATQDYRILPRKKLGQASAERKTELMHHVRDENRSDYEWADAFASAACCGLGWMEGGQGQPEEGAIVYERAESWRNMLWDSTAVQYDLQDARYITRTKWIDIDMAMALWHNRQGIIEHSSRSTTLGMASLDDLGDDAMDSTELAHFQSAISSGRNSWDSLRDRVRIIEMWFRIPLPKVKTMRGGQFNGELFDEWSPGHIEDLMTERATLITRPREVTHCALMTDMGFLDVRKSPYRHGRYPFTPVWGYRRGRDGMPYGLVRGVRDIQRDLNRRAAKALHHLSAKTVLLQEGSVSDIEEVRDEAARPDAVIVYKEGKQPPIITSETNLAAAHVELMQLDASMIQQVGGVTDENLGKRTNATSGKAIHARQDQGQLATSTFFDNLRRSRLIHGEKTLVLIEQFYTEQDEIRITDSRGNPDFKPINDGEEANAIARHKADFIITEEDWRASVRQANAEQLLSVVKDLAATAPQLVVGILDLVVEAMDVSKRDELVKRIRQLNGQPDPDADPNNPDEETQAMNAQKAQQDEMAMRQAKAALMEMEGKARLTTANAAKAEAGIAADGIAQVQAALEAAIAIAGAPAVAAAADRVLGDARAAAAAVLGGQMPPEPQMPEVPAMQQPTTPPAAAQQQPDPAMMMGA